MMKLVAEEMRGLKLRLDENALFSEDCHECELLFAPLEAVFLCECSPISSDELIELNN